jgi:hypothetical protein
MNRYISVNKFVNRVTENEALRTFFTLLLMSNSTEQKKIVERDFWESVDALDPDIRENLFESYRLTLPQLLIMSRELRSEAIDLNKIYTQKAA